MNRSTRPSAAALRSASRSQKPVWEASNCSSSRCTACTSKRSPSFFTGTSKRSDPSTTVSGRAALMRACSVTRVSSSPRLRAGIGRPSTMTPAGTVRGVRGTQVQAEVATDANMTR